VGAQPLLDLGGSQVGQLSHAGNVPVPVLALGAGNRLFTTV
jgi:hypothetical protein